MKGVDAIKTLRTLATHLNRSYFASQIRIYTLDFVLLKMNGNGNCSVPGLAAGFALFTMGLLQANTRAEASDFQWLRTAGGSGAEASRRIVVDDAGSSYIIGAFDSTNVRFGNIVLTNNRPAAIPTWDGFIVKYDSGGSVVWAKKFGGTNDDRGSDIAVDAGHNCYVTGWFDSANFYLEGVTLTNFSPAGNSSLFVAKFDPSANLLWVRALSGTYIHNNLRIALDSAGNYYLAGGFTGTNTFGATNLVSRGYSDVLLLKYDPDGNLLWAQATGGSEPDGAAALALDATNNVYLLANIRSTNVAFGSFVFSVYGTNTCQNLVVAKYDPAGHVIWARQGGGTSIDAATDIASDKTGNCYITGNASSTNLFFGSIVLTNNYNPLPLTAIYVAKLNRSGNFVWADAAQGDNNVASLGIALNQFGDCYIAGYFQSTNLVFQPAWIGSVTLTNTESGFTTWADAFVVKFDTYGQLLRVVQPRGPNDQRVYSIAVDSAGNACITGWTQGTNVLFGSFATTNTYLDMFVAKIDPDLPYLQIESGETSIFSLPDSVMLVSWPMSQTGSALPILESSTNLATWFPADIFESIIGGDRYYSVVEKPGSCIFYRVRLSN